MREKNYFEKLKYFIKSVYIYVIRVEGPVFLFNNLVAPICRYVLLLCYILETVITRYPVASGNLFICPPVQSRIRSSISRDRKLEFTSWRDVRMVANAMAPYLTKRVVASQIRAIGGHRDRELVACNGTSTEIDK